MYRQLTEQAEKYLLSLYKQDDIVGELKRKLADLMACGEANADAACRALKLSRRTLHPAPVGVVFDWKGLAPKDAATTRIEP